MSNRDAVGPQEPTLDCLVITLSDRAAAGRYADRSGPRVRELVEAFFAGRPIRLTIANRLLPDEPEQLRQEVLRAKRSGVDLLITTGGTGVGPRDVTPETVAPLCDKLIPGIMEHIRMTCGRQNPRAGSAVRSRASVARCRSMPCRAASARSKSTCRRSSKRSNTSSIRSTSTTPMNSPRSLIENSRVGRVERVPPGFALNRWWDSSTMSTWCLSARRPTLQVHDAHE